jgi:hypothetical protein
MNVEARSALGELVGLILFGEDERSRFLVTNAIRARAEMPLVVKIDNVPISAKRITCPSKSEFCSVVLSVDNGLLAGFCAVPPHNLIRINDCFGASRT